MHISTSALNYTNFKKPGQLWKGIQYRINAPIIDNFVIVIVIKFVIKFATLLLLISFLLILVLVFFHHLLCFKKFS